MRGIKRVWEEIRRGENLDLYITIVVAIAYVILNLFDLAPDDWIAPLTLATLGILIIALLGNRHRFEETVQRLTQSPGSLFQEKFPPDFENDLGQAKEIWLVGVTLNRTIKTYYAIFEQKLKHDGIIKVILVSPEDTNEKKAAAEMAEKRVYERSDVERLRNQIQGTLEDFCSLKSIAPSQVEIRTITYPLGFGVFALDIETDEGVLYLEHYPYKTPGGSLPKFVLHAGDGRWYDFFKMEIEKLWEHSDAWLCQ